MRRTVSDGEDYWLASVARKCFYVIVNAFYLNLWSLHSVKGSFITIFTEWWYTLLDSLLPYVCTYIPFKSLTIILAFLFLSNIIIIVQMQMALWSIYKRETIHLFQTHLQYRNRQKIPILDNIIIKHFYCNVVQIVQRFIELKTSWYFNFLFKIS